jgi:tetratricopeptide (TPR) repeat protein
VTTVTGPEPERFHSPKPRQYEEREHNRDVDAAEKINRLKAIWWSLWVGLFAVPLGLMLGGFPVGLLGGLLAPVLVYYITMSLTAGSARAASSIHNPQGDIAPVKRDYSFAQSLAARGDYAGAIREYEQAILSFPEDPEPYLRVARLHRRELRNPEAALDWFKRARRDARIGRGQELLVTQEIIELYRDELATPTSAIPELARLIDRFPDDPGADAARAELAELRGQLASE